MIHVPRTAVPATVDLVLKRATKRTIEVFSKYRGKQTRFEFPIQQWVIAAPVLHRLFHGKCAYCETPILVVEDGNVDHFRPKLGAADLEEHIDANHYYWLAHEWTNLYLGCGECELNKKTFFPVDGKRVALGASITNERPLLIDPCRDDPEEHLLFFEDGYVTPKTVRGEVTIKLLGLNRTALIEKRISAVADAERARANGEPLAAVVAPNVPYAAAIRAFFREAPPIVAPRRSGKAPAKKRTVRARKLAATAKKFRSGGFLKRIELTNFRSIQKLSLTITPSQGEEQAGWLMLLGENAAGKSSILQAIALALAGTKGLKPFEQSSLDAMIRNGQRKATVVLETSADPPLIQLEFERGETPRFVKGGEGYPGLVLAYGATRIADDTAKISTAGSDQRILNLFDPREPLTPAEAWLLELSKRPKAFNDAAKSLKSLLRIGKEVKTALSVSNKRVRIDHGNGPVLIDQLSAGYHAMLGLGIDIMQAGPAQMTDKRYASGIVILDEIDAHLHPRWKMKVVGLLREAFPMIQFIVSTHEPLCLRGTKGKEVVLMRVDDQHRVRAVTDLPPHETMRVDQLLTSPLFGLYTTLDESTDAEFREYYALLAKAKRTARDRREIEKKKEKLSRHGVLGYTRRDQLIYEFLDDFLAKEMTKTPLARQRLKERTRQKVLAIWRRAGTVGRRT